MIGALAATAWMLAIGLPIALALPGAPRRIPAMAGEAFLLGSAASGIGLMLLSMAGVPWTRATLLVLFAIILTLAVAAVWLRGLPELQLSRPSWANAVDLVTLVLVAGYARFATLSPGVEADYVFIWGSKAKRFWLEGGIDWEFLAQTPDPLSHPGYPILTPLVYDVYAVVSGAWPDRWIGVASVAFGLAGLLVVRGLLAEEMGQLARAIATLLMMPLMFSPYIGLAEAPLVAASVAGLLHLRRAVRVGDPSATLRGAAFLGIAAWHKDEGLALIVAAAVALAVSRRLSLLPRLWPALVMVLSWTILKRVHALPDDIAGGGFARLLDRLDDPMTVFRLMAGYPVGQLLFWLGVIGALLLGIRRVASEERFLAAVICVQLALVIVAYFMTPYDLTWQIRWSWDRIVRQLMPLIALVALFAAGEPKLAAFRRS